MTEMPEDPGSGWSPIEPDPGPRPGSGPGDTPPPELPSGWAAPSPTWDSPTSRAGDERTGPLPMHPMTFSDVIDGAFKLYKANFLTVILITLAITAPVQIVSAFLARDALPEDGIFNVLSDPAAFEATAEAQTDASVSQVVGQIIFGIISVLIAPFVAGAVARVVGASYMGGSITVAEALRATLRRAPALLGAWLLVHLLEFSGLIAIGIGVLITLPLFMAMFVAVAPALVVEELGPVAAMRRSWRLMRPRFWAVLGTALVAGFIAYTVASIVSALPTSLGFVVGQDLGWIFVSLGSLIGLMVSEPIVAIVATLLYFDGRIRHEAFDLEVMARDLSSRRET